VNFTGVKWLWLMTLIMTSNFYTLENNGFQTKHRFISQNSSTTDSQLFNILQQECYSVT